MKKIFSFLILALSTSCLFAQNIGINATGAVPHSSAMLDVSSTNKGLLIPRMTTSQRTAIVSPATGLQVYDTDTNGLWLYNGGGWTQLAVGSPTNFWTLNGTNIVNNNAGNVGIGITAASNKFTVKTATGDYGIAHTDETITVATWIGNFGGASGGWIGTKTNHPLNFFTNGGAAKMTLLPNGNVGIGTVSPTNKFQIGNAVPGYEGYDLYLGDATHGFGVSQSPSVTYLRSNTNLSLFPATGYTGINTTTPANHLQIGSMGPAGFNGNDLAIGNGTNAMVVYQSNASTLLASTTDIVLMPRNNGNGRVGINTSSPRAPLDVQDEAPCIVPNTTNFAYYALSFSNFQPVANTGGTNASNINVSIVASSRVLASEFDAFSDVRIKNIVGISNTANDLATLNALCVSDYTMRDKMKYGDKAFKKVIAQEVEKVYPQVVSEHTDFVPNVYQPAASVEKLTGGYKLSFTDKHNISPTAKKLRALLADGKGMREVTIVSVPSSKEVVISIPVIKDNKIFVYGEEVDDFRTVDYEGLTTLNISATQELSKILKMQQEQLNEQAKEITKLTAAVKLLSDTKRSALIANQ